MTTRTISLLICAFALSISICAGGRAFADILPVMDWTNPEPYRLLLPTSTDSDAAVIRKEIADGPADFVQAKAAIAKEGISLTLNNPAPPENENGTKAYEQWKSMLQSENISVPSYAVPLKLDYQYTPDQLAAAKKLVNDPSNVALMAAVSKPVLYYPQGGPNIVNPAFADLRGAGRQITTLAAYKAIQGNTPAAVAMQLNGFKVERQAAQQKYVIGYLVATGVEQTTIDGLEGILGHSSPDAATDREVSAAVSSSENLLSMRDAVQGDAIRTIAYLESIKTYMHGWLVKDPFKKQYTPADQQFIVQIVDEGEAKYLNSLVGPIKVVNEPSIRRLADLTAYDKEADARDTNQANDPVFSLLVRRLDFVKFSKFDDTRIARDRVLLASLAVLTAKAKTGSYPAALPGTFIDPFSGKPLVYQHDSKGFEVYSVGLTGAFNGHLTPGQQDVENVFSYPAPPAVPLPAPAPPSTPNPTAPVNPR